MFIFILAPLATLSACSCSGDEAASDTAVETNESCPTELRFSTTGSTDSSEEDACAEEEVDDDATTSSSTTDSDGDGVTDDQDNCPEDFNPSQETSGDADDVADACDNCPETSNDDQWDTDADGTGNDCDDDRDGDGYANADDVCPDINSSNQTDTDGDSYGDDCDDFPTDANYYLDTDGDGVADEIDICPYDDDADQLDSDGDGEGNACDDDCDGDLLVDTVDDDTTGCSATSGGDEGGEDSTLPDEVVFTAEDDGGDNHLSYTLTASGDLNGDGYDDLVVSDYGAFKIYIVFGQSTAFSSASIDAVSAVTITNDMTTDAEILTLAIVDDMTGDGMDELLVGIPSYDSDRGRVYLIYGEKITGDFDLSDIGASTYSGRVISLSTSSKGVIFKGEDEGYYTGMSVANAGDVDGDGKGDFLIGAMGYANGSITFAGRTYLIFGEQFSSTSTNLSNVGGSVEGETFTGLSSSDSNGVTVAGLGDINGDGFADFASFARLADDDEGASTGLVYVFLGKAARESGAHSVSEADLTLSCENQYDYCGNTMSAAGDVNGDGVGDFLIGAYVADGKNGTATVTSSGVVYLVFGSITELPTGENKLSELEDEGQVAMYSGENSGDYAGFAVSGGGDFDGDGFADIAAGAPSYEEGDITLGKVYVITGYTFLNSVSLAYADTSFTGDTDDDYPGFGFSLSANSDINGDGLTDLIIGHYLYYNADHGERTGKVEIHYGSTF